MRQFTLAQLLMLMPLVAIMAALVKSEGCGPRRFMASSVTFSPDGRRVAVANLVAQPVNVDYHNLMRDVLRTISVLDLDSHGPPAVVERTFLPGDHFAGFFYQKPTCLAFGPEGQSLLVQEMSCEGVRSYDLRSVAGASRFRVGGGSMNMAASADGTVVVSGALERAVLWDSSTGKELWRISTTWRHFLHAPLLAFSADGKLVAAVGDGDFRPGIHLLNVRDGSLARRLDIPRDQGLLCGVAFSPAGHSLATIFEKSLQIDDLETGRHTEFACGGNAVAFSPDGKKLAVTQPQKVVLLDAASGATVGEIDVSAYVTSLAYSPKEDLIAIGDDLGELALWRVAEGQKLHRISLPGGSGYPWTSWPVPAALLVVWFFVFRRLSRKTGQSREDNGGMTGTTAPSDGSGAV
jgi:WD40 repeat protein